MKSLRLKNLRGLKDTGTIPLKPLTLLVGRNGSGKSTFLRTFPLLRQSAEVRTTGPILWYGPFVDFGSFGTALSTNADNEEIVLEFALDLPSAAHVRSWREPAPLILEDLPLTVKLHLRSLKQRKQDRGAEYTYAKSLRVFLHPEDEACIEFGPSGTVESFVVNGLDVHLLTKRELRYRQGEILPRIFTHLSSLDRNQARWSRTYFLQDHIDEALKPFFHWRLKASTRTAIAQRLGIGSPQAMYQNLKALPSSVTGRHFQRHIHERPADHPDFKKVRTFLLASSLPQLIDHFDVMVRNFARGVTYVAPVRASAERYYRVQELAVNEVDFQGKNLPMFLHSLGRAQLTHFAKWTKSRLGFSVDTSFVGGHVSIHMIEAGSVKRHNLADMGFGFSQLLPIAAQLWYLETSRRTIPQSTSLFCVEQPELHLHPAYQSKIADVMMKSVSASKEMRSNIKILVETHSQTIINRIGSMIADGKFSKDDVQIVLFERPDSKAPSIVRLAEFDDDGFLRDWPYGFFSG